MKTNNQKNKDKQKEDNNKKKKSEHRREPSWGYAMASAAERRTGEISAMWP